MTEQEWATCQDPQKMLDSMQGRCSFRRWLQFRCARLRRYLAQTSPIPPADVLDRETADILESLADGLTDTGPVEHLIHKRNRAKAAFVARQDFEGAAANRDWTDFLSWCCGPASACRQMYAGNDDLTLLLDLFGNPFQPVTINPDWITPTVLSLAQAAYEERSLPSGTLDNTRLAILSDGLEDNGCDNADILNHLRQPVEHYRGCWAVDMVLGKE